MPLVTIDTDDEGQMNDLVTNYVHAARHLGHRISPVGVNNRENIAARLRMALDPQPEPQPCLFTATINGIEQQCPRLGPHRIHTVGTWRITQAADA